MKLASFLLDGQEKIGGIQHDGIVDLTDTAPDMITLIKSGAAGLERARKTIEAAQNIIPMNGVELLAPLPRLQRNVMCVGLNYAEHTVEHYRVRGEEAELPQYPVIFTKATTAVNSPFGNIYLDQNVTQELDWEVELAVIIAKSGKNISREEAMDYVFGYCVLNDVSARDLQRNHQQFFKGKSLDGSCPMGPWIVTADELPEITGLRVTSRVNGVTKQDSSTDYMMFDVPALIDHLSRGMTLLPGDIIATGTPGGVGFARTPPEFLKAGDVVESEVEGIGLIRNTIVPAGD